MIERKKNEKGKFNKICTSQAFDIELTNACSLSCKTCLRKTNKNLGYIQDNTFKRIIDITQGAGFKEIFLSGHGDVFLHKNFFQLLDYLYLKNPLVKVVIPTKGQSINTDIITGLKNVKQQGKNLTLCFSVFSLDRYKHEYLTGGSYDDFWKTVKKVNDAGIDYSFDFLLSSYSVDEMDKFKGLARSINKDYDFSVVYNWNGLMPDDYHSDFVNAELKNMLVQRKHDEKCEAFINSYLYFDYTGSAYPCTLDMSKKHCLGDIHVNDFQEIIESKNNLDYEKTCNKCFNYKYRNLELQ